MEDQAKPDDGSTGELVIGTHLYPLRYFGDFFDDYPDNIVDKASEVVRTINIDSHEIL